MTSLGEKWKEKIVSERASTEGPLQSLESSLAPLWPRGSRERERERNDANVRERITDERKSGSLLLARGWGEVSIKRVFHHQCQGEEEEIYKRAINPRERVHLPAISLFSLIFAVWDFFSLDYTQRNIKDIEKRLFESSWHSLLVCWSVFTDV